MTSLEDEIIPPARRKKKARPAKRHATGIIVPVWWRWQFVVPAIVIAILSTGFSIYLLSGTQQRVVEQRPAANPVRPWYQSQTSPTTLINLTGNKALFPDPEEVTEVQASRAYEEALPQNLYEQAPVATGLSDIASVKEITGNGATRYVLPEEDIPEPYRIGPLESRAEPVETVTPVTSAPEQQIAAVSEPGPASATPLTTRKDQLAWQQNALPFSIPANAPMIAIVIDDMGVDVRRSRRAAGLPGPLTLSYLTYASNIQWQSSQARSAGHELMLHIPMQPENTSLDPGPNVLDTTSNADEILRRLRWGMEQFDGYIGLNNHMGSRFTQFEDGMRVVMKEVQRRGLIFLDSRTTGTSVAAKTAHEAGVTFASRNVFLDHVDDADTVLKQLRETERLALRNGSAIAIGHPRDATLDVLEQWLPSLAERGFVLAPLSAIILRTQQKATEQANTTK